VTEDTGGLIFENERKLQMVGIITINGEVRNLSEINPSWIVKQIKGLEGQGLGVCVYVKLNGMYVDLNLAAGVCPGAGGGRPRRFSPQEQEIIDEWLRLGLNAQNIHHGHLISFLKKLHLMR